MTPRAVQNEIAAAGLLLASYPLDLISRQRERLIPRFGRELVVLAHGYGGSRANFLAFAAYLRLTGFHNVAFFEYPRRQSLVESARQLGEMISGLSPDGTAHIVGHSLGGTIGRVYAASAPRRSVHSLVSIGSPYGFTPTVPYEIAIFGNEDPIVPPPLSLMMAQQMFKRTVVIRHAGHLAILYHPQTLRIAATELRENRRE